MARGTHYGESKADLHSRLRKMEGQVRGLQQMIDADRYCLDVVQQVNAVTAGLREVSLIVVESHLRAIVADAVKEHDGDAAIVEMLAVLRKTLRP